MDKGIFEFLYLRNGARETHGFSKPVIGNHICRDIWRHVTPKGQSRDPKII